MSKKNKTVAEEEPFIAAESLEIEGSLYKTTLPAKYKNQKPYKAQNPNHVLAFMPGTVRDIFVSAGDKVAKGDKMLVLDAMKMNNEILSPMDGVVEKIAVKSGESVPKQALLVAMKPTAAR